MKRDTTQQGPSQKETSRFSYFDTGDAPETGGVHSTFPPASTPRPGVNPAANQGPRPAANGAPGPEERLLEISELARNIGMHYVHRFQIPPVAGAEEDLSLAGPMEGTITLTNTGAVLLITGDARAPLTLECGRCLTPTIVEVKADIEEQFDLIAANNAFRQEVVAVVDEDTPASVIEGGNVLKLGELLRQNLLVAAPLQPLCREDCPGIDLSGHQGVAFLSEEDAEKAAQAEPAVLEDNPLRRLADLLEAKRRQEEKGGETAA
ncbi:MAG: DUF177 domain-containing protein [Cytophagales bacterium]|nr:DUF177 domain-containing protein [Armatimonadota bacterium]